MLHFDDIEGLVNYMFEKANTDNPITVAADKDLAVGVMTKLLTYKNVALEFVDIDIEYDREYYATLLYDEEESDCWRVSVEKAYNDVRGEYFGMDGYILFHEDTNSKILVDIQNNENVGLSGHDWFVIGADDSFETDGEAGVEEVSNDNSTNTSTHSDIKPEFPKTVTTYRVNGKKTDKATFDAVFKEFKDYENEYLNMLQHSLFGYRYPRWMREWMYLLDL